MASIVSWKPLTLPPNIGRSFSCWNLYAVGYTVRIWPRCFWLKALHSHNTDNCLCFPLLSVSITEQSGQPFNSLFSETIWVSRHQKGWTNLDLKKQQMTGWQWHQHHMQIICILLKTDNQTSTSSFNFLQDWCSSWCPTKCQSTKGTQDKADWKYYWVLE